jgi:polysaccharide export outer membrane protein
MTDLVNLAPAGGWQRLAFDAAWQGALVAAIAVATLRLARRRPAVRAGIALVAIVLCLATPLVSSVARLAGWGLLAAQPAAQSHTSLPDTQPAPRPAKDGPAPIAVIDGEHRLAIAWQPAQLSLTNWASRVLAVAWLLASTALAARLVASARAVRRTCHSAVPCADAEIQAALERAAVALRVCPPLLCLSSTVDSPALVTWGHPRLLLPARAAPRSDWFAVFCHELAHLARRDGRSRLAVEIVTVLLPWQPVVWLLRREFRAACEQACDDWAVAAGADPVEFASSLLDFVPQARSALVMGMSETVAATRSRIMRLLAMQGVPRPHLGLLAGVTGWIAAIALAVVLALLQYGRNPWGAGADLPPWGDVPAALAAAKIAAPADQPPLTPYVVDVPDVLLIDAVKVVPKPPYHIEPQDTLEIFVQGTLVDQNIAGPYPVEADGTIMLGPAYGSIKVSGFTLSEAQQAIRTQLESIITSPQVAVSLNESAGKQEIKGEHLIGPDGKIILGSYGSVYVAGMTVPEVRQAVEAHLEKFLDKPEISVDIFSYNSKHYYVATERDGANVIHRFPCTGHERVLDALTEVTGLQLSPTALVWVSRAAEGGRGDPQILPVDWRAIFRGQSNATNYWLLPTDRIFVKEK